MMVVTLGFASVRSAALGQVGIALLAIVSLLVHELYAHRLLKNAGKADLGMAAALTEAGSRHATAWVLVVLAGFTLGLVLFLRAYSALHRRIDV
jgi:hypothetical protein